MSCIYPDDDEALGVVGVRGRDARAWTLAERLYAWVTHALQSNEIVLDYGCGSGYGAQILALWLTEGYVAGIDRDATAIAYAEKCCKLERMEFGVDDLLQNPKPLQSAFSSIVCVESLFDGDRSDLDVRKLAEALLPSLRPNGQFIAIERPERLQALEDVFGDLLPIRGYFWFSLIGDKGGYRIAACRPGSLAEDAERVVLVGRIIPRRDMAQNVKYRQNALEKLGVAPGMLLYDEGSRFVVLKSAVAESDVGTGDVHSLMVRDFREPRRSREWEPNYKQYFLQGNHAYEPGRVNWGENYERNKDLIALHPGTREALGRHRVVYLVAPGRSLEKNARELAGVEKGLILALNGAARRVPRSFARKIALMFDAKSLISWVPEHPGDWELWASGLVPREVLEAPWKSLHFVRLTGCNPAFEDMNERVPEALLIDSCLSVAPGGMNLAMECGCRTLVHVGMGDAWEVKDGKVIKHHASGTGYEIVGDVPQGAMPIVSREGKSVWINDTYLEGTNAVGVQNYFFLEPAEVKAGLWQKHADDCAKAGAKGEHAVALERVEYWRKRPSDEHIRVIDASECDASILPNKYGHIPHELEIMPLSTAIRELEQEAKARKTRTRTRRRR